MKRRPRCAWASVRKPACRLRALTTRATVANNPSGRGASARTGAVAPVTTIRIRGGAMPLAVTGSLQALETLRHFVGHLEEGIYVTTADGDLLDANPALLGIFGVASLDELRRYRVQELWVEPARRAEELAALRRDGRVRDFEIQLRRPGGEVRTVLDTCIASVDAASGRTLLFGILVDVTERHRMEERLRNAQRLEAVGRLAGGLAHDFNNLLQAMLGVTDLLRTEGEATRDHVDELEELLHRGAQLTRQLLLFSRREEPRAERFDLNVLVRDTARLLRRLLRENVELRMELADGPLEVVADRGQLGQVWMNLAVNAADAMPDGGTLTVRSGRAGAGQVWFAVEDTGHGIPEEARAHIFEPFFTTKRDHRGTGLGLSVVHGIVAGHGGRIEVTGETGGGTSFRVVLPAGGVADPARGLGAAAADQLPRGQGESLLLVEDNDSVRRTFERLLTGLGYRVVAVESAEDAARLPESAPFDLLLTDVLLPGASGGELARHLKARWPALAVVFMSGYTEDEIIRHDVAVGGARYLQKPVDIGTLGGSLRAALDASR
jgi:two-component system cell cycle sensor histidine kinase/response regulator CckA